MLDVTVKNTYEANVKAIAAELAGRQLVRLGNTWHAKFGKRVEAQEAVHRLRLLHGVQAWIEGDGQQLPKVA
jgi:hypothetical protein